jgi:small subunit ribosomal protein S20
LANHKSALKRNRQSLVRKARNSMNKTRVKTAFKKAKEAIGGPSEAADLALRHAMSTIHKAVIKGSLHKRTASRRISRLSKQVYLGTQAAASSETLASTPSSAES